MISLERIKRIDTSLQTKYSDEELEKIRLAYYELAQLMFDGWIRNKLSSKSLNGSLTDSGNKSTI